MSELLYKDLTYQIRGILFSVQNELGSYCNEKQYGDAFEQRLKQANLKYEREKILTESFPGELKGRNRVDFLIEKTLLVELKCVSSLSRDDYFQCQRYLSSLNLDLCLLINFRPKYLMIKRVLNPNKKNTGQKGIRKSGLSGNPDSKAILGLVGEMAAGKGTAAGYLKEKYGASTYRFSDMLADMLDRLHLPHNRDNFIKMSEMVRGTFGEDIMAKTMAQDVEKDQNKLIIVEGVRRLADIEYLKKMSGFVLVEIFADIEKRFARMKSRGEKSDDGSKTLAEFKADHKRSTELSILEVARQASLRIDNNGTKEQLYEQLDRIVIPA